jgi:ribosomal protein L7Ae-like RNA K-turn-binding protein
VHPTQRCFEDAVRRGFARSARAEVVATVDHLAAALGDAAGQRAHALVGVAVRARKAAVGTTAVEEADSRLTLVAVDAAAQREVDVVKELAGGKALAFGTKRSLGEACGRDVVGVVAITDASLATAVRDAVALSLAAAAIRGL